MITLLSYLEEMVYDVQSPLLDLFPEEGGKKDPTQRMIHK